MNDAPAENIWVTVCDGCREWVTGIFHVTLSGDALCINCAAAMGVPTGPVEKKRIRLGPPAPVGAMCPVCGRPGAAQCEGCRESFCGPHWWKHSHGGPIGSPQWRYDAKPLSFVLEVPAMAKGEWCDFLPREACPICGHCGWCSVAPDGDAIQCRRVPSDRPAYAKDGTIGWMHPVPDSAATVSSAKLKSAKPSAPKRSPAEWDQLARQHRSDLQSDRLREFAALKGLTAKSLDAFYIGWDITVGAFTWPMRDAGRRIIGIRRWHSDGRGYRCVPGSANGLFIPSDYSPRPGDPLLTPEGPTDAATAHAMGLRVVGRPNSSGGAELLGQLLRKTKVPQDVVVVGENDGPKWALVPNPPPPLFPGFAGAVACCRTILPDCGRLRCIVPPRPWKDLRDWKTKGHATLADVMLAVTKATPIAPGWFVLADIVIRRRQDEAVATFHRACERMVRYRQADDLRGPARAERIRAWLVRRGFPLDVRREVAA